MKTTLYMLIVLFFLGLNTFKAEAQLQVGGGFAWGSEVEELGLQFNATYNLPVENLRIGSDFTFYFVDDNELFDRSFSEFNVNAHYQFYQTGRVEVYGIGGINFSFVEVNNVDDTELGLNLGSGAEFDVGFGNVFGELKYVISDFDQLVLAAGVRIPIAVN